MMPGSAAYTCVPIKTEVAERFRRTLIDDSGNPVERSVDEAGGSPCRHCLLECEPGQAVLLGSYNLERPRGIYWTPSPIFIHEQDCRRYSGQDELPEIVVSRFVSLRAYDRNDRIIYELGEALEGREAKAAVAHSIQDARTTYINIHTAKPGCLLCRIERLE